MQAFFQAKVNAYHDAHRKCCGNLVTSHDVKCSKNLACGNPHTATYLVESVTSDGKIQHKKWLFRGRDLPAILCCGRSWVGSSVSLTFDTSAPSYRLGTIYSDFSGTQRVHLSQCSDRVLMLPLQDFDNLVLEFIVCRHRRRRFAYGNGTTAVQLLIGHSI